MQNDNSNMQPNGDEIAAVHEALEALSNSDHYVMVGAKELDGKHEFYLHYSSPLVIIGLVQYAQSIADAWLAATYQDEGEGDED